MGASLRLLVALLIVAVTACSSASSELVTSDFEREVLSGGVTKAELELARQRTVACIEQEGFTAEFLERDTRVAALQAGSGPPRAGESSQQLEQRFTTAIDSCVAEFHDAIDQQWLRSTAPNSRQQAVAFETLRSCVAPFVALTSEENLALLNDLMIAADEDDRMILEACSDAYLVATSDGQ